MSIDLVAADSPTSFLDDTPTARLIRKRVLGAVSEFEKAMLVAKLKGARDRKAARRCCKVEGRKSIAEQRPETIELARRLVQESAPPKGGKRLRCARFQRHLQRPVLLTKSGTPYDDLAIEAHVEHQK